MANLNAKDNAWSVVGSDEEDIQEFVESLNFCLEHPELDSPEKINAWFAEQKASAGESEDEE
jgi:hypothetical protein